MKDIVEQFMGWCKYFRAPGHYPECEKGVNYDELVKLEELGRWGSGLRKPCVLQNHDEAHRKGQPLCHCEHLQFYTREEAEVEAAKVEAHAADFLTNMTKFMRGEYRFCLRCEQPVKYCMKHGRSVYAYPCGCRQYQGEAPTWTDGVKVRTTTRQV